MKVALEYLQCSVSPLFLILSCLWGLCGITCFWASFHIHFAFGPLLFLVALHCGCLAAISFWGRSLSSFLQLLCICLFTFLVLLIADKVLCIRRGEACGHCFNQARKSDWSHVGSPGYPQRRTLRHIVPKSDVVRTGTAEADYSPLSGMNTKPIYHDSCCFSVDCWFTDRHFAQLDFILDLRLGEPAFMSSLP